MKKSKPIDRNDLGYEEEVEENGLCDFVQGNPIAQFTFDNNFVPNKEPMIKVQPPEVSLTSTFFSGPPDNRTLKSEAT